jgi:sterol desaturase/sphingolipid hydroxylase (fatty acid hydroxylase superfamily)
MVGGKAAKRLGLEILGWTLVVLGIAGLILPGPGLLGLFAGLYVLSQQYDWAERKVEPVKMAAFRAAAEGVQSWPRIIVSLLGVVFMVGVGVVWGMRPPAPGFWPIAEKWWLFGGWPTGITLIVSAFIALALIVFSYQRFHGVDDPVAAAEEAARDKD